MSRISPRGLQAGVAILVFPQPLRTAARASIATRTVPHNQKNTCGAMHRLVVMVMMVSGEARGSPKDLRCLAENSVPRRSDATELGESHPNTQPTWLRAWTKIAAPPVRIGWC